jgi:3-oxoacid CoA-transferase subunit B
VNRIYTDMAVFDITAEGLQLREIAIGSDLTELRAATGAAFHVPDQDLPRF